ncbi:18622_t:CDS:2, partial [Dentiscutata erythropus]
TIEIFQNSLKYIHESTQNVVTIDSDNLKKEISNAKFYENGTEIVRPILSEIQEFPTIEVYNGDCLSYALDIKKNLGLNPVVLNMANDQVPGGNYLYGAGAQEENLFRRTNLFQYHETNRNEWYPIPDAGGIYCPNATVIRASEQENYILLDVPEKMSFVAVAALCQPILVKDSDDNVTLNEEDKELTRQKIRSILNIGLDNGHDSIVLSAFGCGAFSNPPSTIAQLFYEIIFKEYAGGAENLPKTYRHIGFAIFDDTNASQWGGGEGNFLPFKKLFANKLHSSQL